MAIAIREVASQLMEKHNLVLHKHKSHGYQLIERIMLSDIDDDMLHEIVANILSKY